MIWHNPKETPLFEDKPCVLKIAGGFNKVKYIIARYTVGKWLKNDNKKVTENIISWAYINEPCRRTTDI